MVDLMELGLTALNTRLSLLITMLIIHLDLFIKLFLEHIALVEVVLAAPMDGTPLPATSTEAFVVPGVARFVPVDYNYSRIESLVLVTGFGFLSSTLQVLRFVLARLKVFSAHLRFYSFCALAG